MKKSPILILSTIIILFLITNITAIECFDSDKGVNYNTKGVVEIRTSTGSAYYNDTCSIIEKDTLIEYSCNKEGPALLNSSKYECEKGCEDGACLSYVEALPGNNPWQKFINWLKGLFS